MPVDFATPARTVSGSSVISVKYGELSTSRRPIALAGRGAHEADPALRDRLRVQAVGVACHERHAGHADDVGLAAGQREHALPAPADHDRWMRPLHRPRPSRVPVYLDELTRAVELFALPVRLDQRIRPRPAWRFAGPDGRSRGPSRRTRLRSSRRRSPVPGDRRRADRVSPPPWPARPARDSRCRTRGTRYAASRCSAAAAAIAAIGRQVLARGARGSLRGPGPR